MVKRTFNEESTDAYLMTELPKKKGMKCLECSDVIKILKAHNVQVHYQAKHASLYDSLTADETATKLAGKFRSMTHNRR